GRDELQSRIDQYPRQRHGEPLDLGDYERFLRDIGYVLPECNDFTIRTTNVDDEIAVVAGPQLVVPLSNARYALNAANARWGSLYDALYGTDAVPEDGGATRTSTYNKIRGERVVARGRAMLDETGPLARGRHRDVDSYSVEGANLLVRLRDGTSTGLAQPAQFVGYRGEARAPSAVLLRNHGLHLEIKIDRGGLVGRDDPAGIADIVLGIGGHHHHGSRRQRCRGRCGGQGRGLSQLVGPHRRHAHGNIPEERKNSAPPTQSGPGLYRSRRRRASAARV